MLLTFTPVNRWHSATSIVSCTGTFKGLWVMYVEFYPEMSKALLIVVQLVVH